jgi:hypothetical protein
VIPTVGRIVHYTNLGDKDGKYPPQVQAALITAVYRHGPDGVVFRADDGMGQQDVTEVDLHVFYRTGDFFMEKVPQKQTADHRGAWDWPARV